MTVEIALTAQRQPRVAIGTGGPVTPATPPEDWRMPATVTASSGLSAFQTALQAGQATAASKTRPSFVVPAGATEYVDYTVAASATPQMLVVRAGGASNSPGTPTIAIGGVDAGFVPQYPPDHRGRGNGTHHIPTPYAASRFGQMGCTCHLWRKPRGAELV